AAHPSPDALRPRDAGPAARLLALLAGAEEEFPAVMIARSLRVLLADLIDYAGLFPPAALSMQDAVRNYARYAEGEHAWMLGKFVVPEARRAEVPAEFPLSVLGVDEVPFKDIDR